MPFGDRGGRAGFGDNELVNVHFVDVQLYRDDERRKVNDAIDHEPYKYFVRRVLQQNIKRCAQMTRVRATCRL